MRTKLLALCLLVMAPACYHASLTPAAEQVVLLQLRVPTACTKVGRVSGQSRGSVLFGDGLTELAGADMRNHAAAMGATHVLLDTTQAGAHDVQLVGNAFLCAPGAELR